MPSEKLKGSFVWRATKLAAVCTFGLLAFVAVVLGIFAMLYWVFGEWAVAIWVVGIIFAAFWISAVIDISNQSDTLKEADNAG